jgi:hypothetical protein
MTPNLGERKQWVVNCALFLISKNESAWCRDRESVVRDYRGPQITRMPQSSSAVQRTRFEERTACRPAGAERTAAAIAAISGAKRAFD